MVTDQRIRTPLRVLLAALALGLSMAPTATSPAGAQPLAPTKPSVPSPQVTRSNLTVGNRAPSDAGPSQRFDYEFSVFRQYQLGPDVSQTVTIRHSAPRGMTFVGQTPAPGFSCSHAATIAGGVLTCTGTMTATAPGSLGMAHFKVHYRAPALEGCSCFLLATVDPDGTISETNEGDNTASAAVRVPPKPWIGFGPLGDDVGRATFGHVPSPRQF